MTDNFTMSVPFDEALCRVCGYDSGTPPWGEDGRSPLFDTCPCCDVEFGNEDFYEESVLAYRSKWIKNGAKFAEAKMEPPKWNLRQQLAEINVNLDDYL